MENNVISLQTRRTQPAAKRRDDLKIARIQPRPAPQPVVTNPDLVQLTTALIVRLRDGRFNQRAGTYRELDAIARMIERQAGVAPGTWV